MGRQKIIEMPRANGNLRHRCVYCVYYTARDNYIHKRNHRTCSIIHIGNEYVNRVRVLYYTSQ